MKKQLRFKCPLCKTGEIHRLEYDLCYCIRCKEEFALNDTRGMLWYKKKRNAHEREYVVIKKYTPKQIHHIKMSL